MAEKTHKTVEIRHRRPRIYNFPLAGRLLPGAPLAVRLMKVYQSSSDVFHRHVDFHELVLVLSGSALHEIDGRKMILKSGAVLFLKQGSVHRYSVIRYFTHYNILFPDRLLAPLRQRLADSPGFQSLFAPDGPVSEVRYLSHENMLNAIGILENMIREMTARASCWQEMAQVEFERLVIELSRTPAQRENPEDKHEYAYQIGKVLQFMESECSQTQLNLGGLMQYVSMSESNFRHRFQELVGFSPMEYLTRLRLKKAMQLLQLGSSLADAARQTGFSQTDYFSRQFTRYVSLPPGIFRRKLAEGAISLTDQQKILLAPKP